MEQILKREKLPLTCEPVALTVPSYMDEITATGTPPAASGDGDVFPFLPCITGVLDWKDDSKGKQEISVQQT
jgi:hypothetical protein